jgi:hypothetical protein
MLVKTIADNENGRKWEIIKHEADRYSVNYYEFFRSIGWKLTATERDYTKDCIEWEFDCVVA